jgi:hypothetical protein
MTPLIKGMLIPTSGGGSSVSFQWNPAEINGPTANPNYATIGVAGKELPYTTYSNGKESFIRFDLQASQSNYPGEVQDYVDSIMKLTKPEKQGQGMARPPRLRLMLPGFLNEDVVITEATPKYTRMYNQGSLAPTDARISITLMRLGEDD